MIKFESAVLSVSSVHYKVITVLSTPWCKAIYECNEYIVYFPFINMDMLVLSRCTTPMISRKPGCRQRLLIRSLYDQGNRVPH